MTDTDLDQSYSAVCEALTRVGEAGAPMFLSMLCLSLMSRFERADQVLPLIANALAQSDAGKP
ncbi:hypothetical protein [Hydrogenophaga sp.]|jgi:hypothetical protein|uniref:hypothetical protein n=1 Tax=Hydrogenophaga sp. TaxID=1904254 RepID=UPI003F6F2F98